MWDGNKVLLATICFTVFFYPVAAGTGKLLNSASDVVDDLYSGCRQQAMERFVLSGLLRQELNGSEGFHTAWTSHSECSAVIPGGRKEHTAALSTYVLGDEGFRAVFDDAVETMGVNVSTYEKHFHFKALHFLLMDAMTLLRPRGCQPLYFLQTKPSTQHPRGSTVRFGSFMVASSNFRQLKKFEDFDGLVLLNITSCFFVHVAEHVCSDERSTVLLSPAEEFVVEEINHISEDYGDTTYTAIVLKSSQLNSTHNCLVFSRSPPAVSALGFVSTLLISSFLYSAV